MSDFITKDSGERRQFNTGAQRDVVTDKGRYDLISPIMIERLAKLLQRGAEKYNDRNWEKGMPLSVYMDSGMRHLYKFLEGHRDEERQNKLYEEGKTKVYWPNGRHNAKPSKAADVVPYPIDWDDRERFHLFAGFVIGIAKSMGVTLRWGGDWDQDWTVMDNKFDDFPHFEIKE